MISGLKPMGGGSNFCGVGDLRAALPFGCAANLFCCGAGGGGGGAPPLALPGWGGGGGGPAGRTWNGIPIAVAPKWEATGPPLFCCGGGCVGRCICC